MASSAFQPIKVRDADLNRVQQELQRAFEALAAAVPSAPVLVSFLAAGSNGVGPVALPPVKDASGAILRRASQGAKLVAATDITSPADVQGSFEQTISIADQIQQTATANLSAKNILFVVQT